jgi:AbrB family looped-hinge helix DNA binding protein
MSTKVLLKRKNQTFKVKLSTKGQVVIPKLIRDYLEIDENSELIFSLNQENVILTKRNDDVEEIYGSLGKFIKGSMKKISQKQFETDLEKAKDLYFKDKYLSND